MAGEAELPQWLTFVGGGIGIIITTVVVRLGWNKTSEAMAPEQGRIMGAIVDSGAVKDLTLAIEAAVEVGKVNGEINEKTNNELRTLSDEVRKLGNKIEDRR